MDRIYVIIAGSDAKTVASIRNVLLTVDLASEYCDVESLPCPTPEDLLRAVIEKTQHSKVIAIMLEDLTPRFENSGFESIIVQQSFQKKALHHLLDIPEFQNTVSSILILSYPGLDADEEMHLVDKVGNFSVVSGSFESIRNDSGWRQLKSAFMKALRRFTEAEQGSSVGGLEGDMLIHSRAMKEVASLIEKFARVDSTVLITGESGTGKELVARQIHDKSSRSKGPYIVVNSGAIVNGLAESELFGHEKGSFTGASDLHKGYFEIADGGTIFLDEIGELPKSQQVKLLRVLEGHKIIRVGGNKEIPVNVRIIAATNKDLDATVKANEFREDLLYRINTLQIHLPPLRERSSDIVPLVNYFLNQHNAKVDTPKTFTVEALETLRNYSWPGNVRELRHVVEAVFGHPTSSHISSSDVRRHFRKIFNDSEYTTLSPKEQAERDLYQAALNRNEGNRQKTADELGVNVQTVRSKIKKFRLNVPR